MIRVLGTKRIFTILILLGLNALVAATVYVYLMPEKLKKEAEFQALRTQIGTVTSDISRMQVEFDQLTVQQAEFDKLKERGFFGTQGRRQAEKVLQRIQQEAGVVSAVANIQSGKIEENEEAQKASHKILVSPVNLKISAIDDVDIFRYIYLLEKFFPGHVGVQKISMERKAEVTSTVLRSIASGQKPQLVSADIELLWRTMIPEKDVIGVPTEQGVPQ